jgi:hypothetical protein
MQTAPARMISSAQTVAKIGRLMKKSTKQHSSCFLPANAAGYYFLKCG